MVRLVRLFSCASCAKTSGGRTFCRRLASNGEPDDDIDVRLGRASDASDDGRASDASEDGRASDASERRPSTSSGLLEARAVEAVALDERPQVLAIHAGGARRLREVAAVHAQELGEVA